MSEFLLLLFNAALINNLALSHLLGLDLQVAASRRVQVALFTGMLMLVSITLCMPLARAVDALILVPLHLQHLDVMAYVLTMVCVVTCIQHLCFRLFPLIVEKNRALLPLLLMNTILPGVMLLQQASHYGFFMLILLGLANGIGFLFLLLLITCLRERIDEHKVPVAFRGIPVLLISLGIFSMGLMGLTGLE